MDPLIGNGFNSNPDFNYVVVRHDDDTFAQYQHLTKNGVLAKLGDEVTVDQAIALSGNSGVSAAPHLHFVVYTVESATRLKSMPVTRCSRL